MLQRFDDTTLEPFRPSLLWYNETHLIHEALEELFARLQLNVIHADEPESLIELAYDNRVDFIFLNLDPTSNEGLRILRYCEEVPELQEIPILVSIEAGEQACLLQEQFKAIDLFTQPLLLSSIEHRLELYLKLIGKSYAYEQSKQMLHQQLRHIQAILNAQEEMLAVFSDQNIMLANSRFLHFFEVETLEEFLLEYDAFESTFIQEEDSFVAQPHQHWITLLMALPSEERNVVIRNSRAAHHRFRVQIQTYTLDQIYYVVTLFDMTDLYLRSKTYERFAFYDLLTGVANRRKFEDRLDEQMSLARRHGTPLSIMLFDLDHFKSINDTYGHDTGDAVLRAFASALSKQVRKEDLFARWGGEEFIMLLVHTDQTHLPSIASKMLEAARTVMIDEHRSLTCSIGMASFQNDMDKHALIKKADDALYRAKANGRNRFESGD